MNLHRSSGPLEFMIGYTYSKSLDESSSLAEPVNPIDPRLSEGLSAFDMRHNFVASYRYQLPIGNVLHRHDGWTDGWALSGLTRFATGFPVTFYNNTDSSLLGTIPNGINNNGVDTPDFTDGDFARNNDPRNGKPAFNTSLFSLPALGQVGNAPRRFFAGPGIENFDMALQKNVNLSESRSLECRLEAFNILNHAQFRSGGGEWEYQQREFRSDHERSASPACTVGGEDTLLGAIVPGGNSAECRSGWRDWYGLPRFVAVEMPPNL